MDKILGYIKKTEQYYSTPKGFVTKILDSTRDLKRDDIRFLDVCAGSGNISDVVKERYDNADITCIEINEVLRNSLKGKGYNVIGTDFEDYIDSPSFDLIFMNPPFSRGANFTLKAYKNLWGGGKLISIVNAETIKNPYTAERKLLMNMIESSGEVEFFSNIFSNSEHKTDVEVAVIILEKPIYETEFDLFGNVQDEIKTDEELIKEEYRRKITETDIMPFDKLDHTISLYRDSVKQIFNSINTINELRNNLTTFNSQDNGTEFNTNLESFLKVILEESNPRTARIETTKLIRKRAWDYVLKFCNMDQYLFSTQRSKFYSDLNDMVINLPFTKNDILQFFNNIFMHREELLKEGIVDLFDTVTNYHSGNRFHTEGWKTNKNWKINKKIIVPWGIEFNDYSKYGYGSNTGKYNLSYGTLEWLDDLDKIVRFIDKPDFRCTFIREALRQRFNQLGEIQKGVKYDNTTETHYFELKFFKKGTLHIVFKDQKILDELNVIGSKLRKDLGYDGSEE